MEWDGDWDCNCNCNRVANWVATASWPSWLHISPGKTCCTRSSLCLPIGKLLQFKPVHVLDRQQQAAGGWWQVAGSSIGHLLPGCRASVFGISLLYFRSVLLIFLLFFFFWLVSRWEIPVGCHQMLHRARWSVAQTPWADASPVCYSCKSASGLMPLTTCLLPLAVTLHADWLR